jgi:DNA-binding CsgD family transcriptional regulator
MNLDVTNNSRRQPALQWKLNRGQLDRRPRLPALVRTEPAAVPTEKAVERHAPRGGDQQVLRAAKSAYAEALRDAGQPPLLNLVESLGHAAVLLDKTGAIVAANTRAEQLLGTDLKIRAGRLVAADCASDKSLQNLLRDAVGQTGVGRSIVNPVVIRRTAGRPLVVHLLPLAGLEEALGEGARAILLFTCLDAKLELLESRLMLLFQLTPAEARLAARLGKGETLEEAAHALHVSPGTTRAQLKTIFSKTETDRQAALIALLWRVSHLAITGPAPVAAGMNEPTSTENV